MNAGDSLNTQNEPEETMKKEKKSEALNIRGRVDGVELKSFSLLHTNCAELFISICLFIGVLESWRVTCRDYDLGPLPNGGIDSLETELLMIYPCST